MNIFDIDKNFKQKNITLDNVKWYDLKDLPTFTYGIKYDNDTNEFRRIPHSISNTVSFNVDFLSANSSGGRIRFKTNSPYVAIFVQEPNNGVLPHMAMTGQFGFSVYADKRYIGCIFPRLDEVLSNSKTILPKWEETMLGENVFSFSGVKNLFNDGKTVEVEIFCPLYGIVKQLNIGVKDGSILEDASSYKYDKPIVFYGSSVTQGACATRPGLDYINLVSQSLNVDIYNLGFSGSALAEDNMAKYIASLDMKAFVYDYSYNAPNSEYLEKTYIPFYNTIRKAHPDMPIILISKPCRDLVDPNSNLEMLERFHDIALKSYNYLKENGDSNIYYLDGKELIQHDDDLNNTTVDLVHPNDIGFQNMAHGVIKLLKEIL